MDDTTLTVEVEDEADDEEADVAALEVEDD